MKYEFANSPFDAVAKRLRYAYENKDQARLLLKAVVGIQSEDKRWDERRKKEEFDNSWSLLQKFDL